MPLALLRRMRTKRPDRGSGLRIPLPVGAGAFSCEVLDPVGQALGGVEVTVTETRGAARTVAKATTDPHGLFLATLEPGQYTVLLTGSGLQPNRLTVDIVYGQSEPPRRVQMEPSQQLELPPPGTWLFDPPHTAIRFIARHVGMANVHGRFTRFRGGIHIAERMEDSRVEVVIDASSINTGNNTRDNHLRSADFLDVENFPEIHFASNRFTWRSGPKWTLQGPLTMHGVSRSVTLDTTYLGAVNGGYDQELRCAALATAELHREDYTLNWRNMLARGIAVVGPTVKLELDIQAMYRSHDTPTPPE
ncbi:YceI family protein [Streptomyces sp. NEAU-YJ-81]|uniref:YceI family protein n=1 Tax=Streptomyces sp. NEAU-YJ-81 TaxID=2820288 RepID=UPI001ABC1D82|nr:YceI family protein [Streptomyces sp. NEAU-YJ-81]MBO3681317.1 YceI family protein [Streptomyces sp. NEAU-YJ-81]